MTEKDKYLKDLFEDLKYSISKFDEQSLLISSGALGLSLTFIKDIVPLQDSKFIWLFYSALFFFVISMGLGFIGHYISARQISNTINLVIEGKYAEIKADKLIPKINFFIFAFLIVGIFVLVSYCVINIEIAKNKKIKDSSESINLITKTENHIDNDSINSKKVKL
jgi:hypothetical protein